MEFTQPLIDDIVWRQNAIIKQTTNDKSRSSLMVHKVLSDEWMRVKRTIRGGYNDVINSFRRIDDSVINLNPTKDRDYENRAIHMGVLEDAYILNMTKHIMAIDSLYEPVLRELEEKIFSDWV